MKVQTIFIINIMLLTATIHAQKGVDAIMTGIEKNNTTLMAFWQEKEAHLSGNMTHLYPSNPQVEFNYLWGNNNLMSDRMDIIIRQSFDFPSAYAFKSQIAEARNTQAELNYQEKRRGILLEARLLCMDLIYINARISEMKKRLEHAQNIERSVRAKFEKGESGILDWNKAKLSLLNLQKVYELAEIDRQNYLSELARLNGGMSVGLSDSSFDIQVLPADFDSWYLQVQQKIPYLSFLEQEIKISRKQEKLALAMSLPRFSAGYISENSTGDILQGITAGITIPLWENKNTVKYNQLQTLADQSYASDAGKQYFNHLRTQYNKAISLQNTLNDYKSVLDTINNSQLLWKAYEMGELSLIEYIMELTVYYESVDKMLETDRELNKTIVVMNQYK